MQIDWENTIPSDNSEITQTVWSSQAVTFDPAVINESDRVIEGIATAPIYDRQNELITAEAIKKALPDFMVAPVLTVQHKEFIAGYVKDAWFDDEDRLHIKALIKCTPELDGVWNLIKAGRLNAFSISGTRNVTTCSLHSNSPCITSDISLNAITICGDNKVNPEAHFDVVAKAISTADTEEVNMVEETIAPEATPEAQVQPSAADIAKAVLAELRESGSMPTLVKSDDEEVEKSCEDEIEKSDAEEVEKEEEKKEEQNDDEMKKALSEITKALEDLTGKYDSLSKSIEAIMNNPLNKSVGFAVKDGQIVSVPIDLQKAEEPKKVITRSEAAFLMRR